MYDLENTSIYKIYNYQPQNNIPALEISPASPQWPRKRHQIWTPDPDKAFLLGNQLTYLCYSNQNLLNKQINKQTASGLKLGKSWHYW